MDLSHPQILMLSWDTLPPLSTPQAAPPMTPRPVISSEIDWNIAAQDQDPRYQEDMTDEPMDLTMPNGDPNSSNQNYLGISDLIQASMTGEVDPVIEDISQNHPQQWDTISTADFRQAQYQPFDDLVEWINQHVDNIPTHDNAPAAESILPENEASASPITDQEDSLTFDPWLQPPPGPSTTPINQGIDETGIYANSRPMSRQYPRPGTLTFGGQKHENVNLFIKTFKTRFPTSWWVDQLRTCLWGEPYHIVDQFFPLDNSVQNAECLFTVLREHFARKTKDTLRSTSPQAGSPPVERPAAETNQEEEEEEEERGHKTPQVLSDSEILEANIIMSDALAPTKSQIDRMLKLWLILSSWIFQPTQPNVTALRDKNILEYTGAYQHHHRNLKRKSYHYAMFHLQVTRDLDQNYNDKTDNLFDLHGIQVVVDKRSMIYLEGATIDFHNDLNKRGFSVTNPQAKSTCGCGSSYSM